VIFGYVLYFTCLILLIFIFTLNHINMAIDGIHSQHVELGGKRIVWVLLVCICMIW
jgi:hypothetical protein